ncbi:MAG: aspartate-semialdehyde dehydrogenase [Sedimentisphaerales bacterium]|nr:aspartate-semialdehyde dehydrogenase [Sedimentisphaerales bacterium]
MAGVVAVVGVTGAVGQEFLALLAQRAFPADEYRFLASARSAGKTIAFAGRDYTVAELTETSFEGVDIALFSAGGSISKQFAPIAARRGTIVVDNSSAFRMEDTVPLVIPEINPETIDQHQGIIANPNCSTIIGIVPIWPLHRHNPVRRMVVSTYQAVSGAGARAMTELLEQSQDVLEGRPPQPEVFDVPCAFNCFSHNSKIDENGYNIEEMKMVHETHKIFHDDSIAITCTCIRVPVLRAHCESINLEFENPIEPEEVVDLLLGAPGVSLIDDRQGNRFPMPLDATGRDDIFVGRIRRDLSLPDRRGINLWVAGDQLRKGAALNAVQIAEYLVR